MLDVSCRLVVIVGGGKVAARKVAGVLAAGATRVRVVSPAFCDTIPAGVERVAAGYEPGHLAGAGLVFAATDSPAVNDAVVQDAHRLGVLVNRADGSESLPGDFTSPAVHRQAAVVLAVSAGGSPRLAARFRDSLAGHLDRDLLMMADAMQTLRPRVLADDHLTEPQRRDLFHRLASDEAIAVLRDGGMSSLEAWMMNRTTPGNPHSAIRNPQSEIPNA
jgi:siroheme synthase-like protein